MAWLYRRTNSKIWWLGFRQHGQQILRSTKTDDRTKAKAELARVEAMLALQASNALGREVYEAITGTKVPSRTLCAAVESWLGEVAATNSERTGTKYRAVINEMLAHFKANESGPHLADITRDDLQVFLQSKRNQTSAATTNNIRTIVGVFFEFCKLGGYLRDNPIDLVKQFASGDDEAQARRPFSTTELNTMFNVAPSDFWKYMILAGFYTGLRLGDLATMPIGAVDFKERVIRITTRKTGRKMNIPLAPALHAMLLKLAKERKGATPTDPFWPDMAARYEKTGAGWFSQRFYDLVLVKAGLAQSIPHRKKKSPKTHKDARRVNAVSFHCLRHSYVTTLAASGMNQQTVKELAGHSSDEINDLYTKLPLETMRAAIGKLPDFTTEATEPKAKS